MNRRGFLQSILAAATAPAVVQAASLMPTTWVRSASGLFLLNEESVVLSSSEAILNVAAVQKILTIDQITKEALRIMYDKLIFVDTDYSTLFKELH